MVLLLEPWLDHARGRLSMEQDVFVQASDVRNDLWIQWHAQTFSIMDIETMELLELLTRVNFKTAWRTILLLAAHESYLDLLLEASETEPLYPRFAIMNLEDVAPKSSMPQTLRWLLFPIDPADHTPGYQAVRDALLQGIAKKNGGVPFGRSPCDRIPFKLHFRVYEGAHVLDEIALLAPFVRDPQRAEIFPEIVANAEPSDIFILDSVSPRNAIESDASLRKLKALSSVWGIAVDYASLPKDAFSSPQVAVEYLRTTLVVTRPQNPTKLSLDHRTSPSEFQAACSAAMVSRELRSVTLAIPPRTEERTHVERDPSALAWAWIAYSLFSREASHAIEEVSLVATDLTVENVEAFAAVLQTNDPLALIPTSPHTDVEFQSKNRDPRPAIEVDICPQANLLLRATSTNSPGVCITTGNTIESLRVVEDLPSRRYVCVVYPGAGVCWVDRTQIVATRVVCPPSSPRRHSIRSLKLDIDVTTSVVALTRLLKLVGPDLESLALQAFGDPPTLSDSFMKSIFSSCPFLRRLDLVALELTDLKWVTTSGLTSVSLNALEVDDEMAFHDLFAELESYRGPLVELHLQYGPGCLQSLLSSVERTLDRSRHLERLVLSLSTTMPWLKMPVSVKDGLRERHGAPLHAQRAPLKLRNRLAFLSVLTTAKENTDGYLKTNVKKPSQRLLPELDAEVIALIFRFAAHHKQRSCGTIHHVDTHWW